LRLRHSLSHDLWVYGAQHPIHLQRKNGSGGGLLDVVLMLAFTGELVNP
jgi:hypothetical protein